MYTYEYDLDAPSYLSNSSSQLASMNETRMSVIISIINTISLFIELLLLLLLLLLLFGIINTSRAAADRLSREPPTPGGGGRRSHPPPNTTTSTSTSTTTTNSNDNDNNDKNTYISTSITFISAPISFCAPAPPPSAGRRPRM